MSNPLTKGLYVERKMTCDRCGKEIITRAKFRGKRFCSEECRKAGGSWSYTAFHANDSYRQLWIRS